MHAWTVPAPPRVEGGTQDIQVWDSSRAGLAPAHPESGVASMYVCGITPYDATHLGHASTYLAFDTLHRLWLDAGMRVRYTQNITDVDDPLLERAARDGVDWEELAASQIQLFREDMTALNVLPPTEYLGVTEAVSAIATGVLELIEHGFAYLVATPEAEHTGACDVYFDSRAAAASTSWHLGLESRLDVPEMLALSAERGGDPDRPGKRDPLDPLLWRVARAGEPRWDSPLGAGRPGWHIECSVIARDTLGPTITVQGGGSDLIFPHHEFSAAHSTALSGEPFAEVYAHSGMVGYEGEKMSKSLGNLVLVSRLREQGVDPRAIRLAILAQHYRRDWEWTDFALDTATARLEGWSRGARGARADDETARRVVDAVRARLARDLDTPAAMVLLDAWFDSERPGSPLIADAVDSLFGVRLDAS